MVSLAPSPASSSVEAPPTPPDPPTRITSLPRSDSGNRRLLLGRDIAAGSDDQEHREYLAVTQVVLEKSGDHQGNHHRDRSAQDEAAVSGTGRQAPQRY